MALLEYAIELGSSFTTIYSKRGNTPVLREPSVIAVDPNTKEVKEVGRDAKKLLGKTEALEIIYPIEDSQIANKEMAVAMLSQFVRKITPKRVVIPRIKFYLLCPVGTTQEELDNFREVCHKSGVNEVVPIWSVIASAVGAGLPLTSANPSLIVDIGGGSTKVAAVNLNGIIQGLSLNVSGRTMDKDLIDYLATEKGIKVGFNSIEKIKEEIGSLATNEKSSITISGKDVETFLPKTIAIGSQDLYRTLAKAYYFVVDAIKAILQLLNDEVTADVVEKGIFVVGGGALIQGLSEYIEQFLKIKTFVIEQPEFVTMIGAGKLINDSRLLNEVLSSMDA